MPAAPVIPAKAGIQVIPAKAGIQVIPAKAGIQVIPAKAGIQVIPAKPGIQVFNLCYIGTHEQNFAGATPTSLRAETVAHAFT
jgi:hypothetical protein